MSKKSETLKKTDTGWELLVELIGPTSDKPILAHKRLWDPDHRLSKEEALRRLNEDTGIFW